LPKNRLNSAFFVNNLYMIKQKNDYGSIKSAIEKLLGETVDVSVNLGRNKIERYTGVVSACYQALFTVCPSTAFQGKTSFSYSEVMCGRVRVEPPSKSG